MKKLMPILVILAMVLFVPRSYAVDTEEPSMPDVILDETFTDIASELVSFEYDSLADYGQTEITKVVDESVKLLSPTELNQTQLSGASDINKLLEVLYTDFQNKANNTIRFFDIQTDMKIDEVMEFYNQLPVTQALQEAQQDEPLSVPHVDNARNEFERGLSRFRDQLRDGLVELKNQALRDASAYIDEKLDEYQRSLALGKPKVYSAPFEQKGFFDELKGFAGDWWKDFKSEIVDSKIDPETGKCLTITDDAGQEKEYDYGFLSETENKGAICRSIVDQFNVTINNAQKQLKDDIATGVKGLSEEIISDVKEKAANAPSTIKGIITGESNILKKADEAKKKPKQENQQAAEPEESASTVEPGEQTESDKKTMATINLFLEIEKPQPDISRIDDLITAGADTEAFDAEGYTPLLRSLVPPRKEQVAMALLDNFADPNTANKFDSRTPLMLAASKEYLEIKPEDPDVLAELLKSGASVNERDRAQKTAFLYAAQAFNIEALKQLLKSGADVNAKDSEDKNALYKVAEWYLNQKAEFVKQGREEKFNELVNDIVTLLIESNIDIDQQEKVSGNTALMWFTIAGASDIVELLLENEADKTIKNKDGKIALDYAQDYSIRNLLDPESQVWSIYDKD